MDVNPGQGRDSVIGTGGYEDWTAKNRAVLSYAPAQLFSDTARLLPNGREVADGIDEAVSYDLRGRFGDEAAARMRDRMAVLAFAASMAIPGPKGAKLRTYSTKTAERAARVERAALNARAAQFEKMAKKTSTATVKLPRKEIFVGRHGDDIAAVGQSVPVGKDPRVVQKPHGTEYFSSVDRVHPKDVKPANATAKEHLQAWKASENAEAWSNVAHSFKSGVKAATEKAAAPFKKVSGGLKSFHDWMQAANPVTFAVSKAWDNPVGRFAANHKKISGGLLGAAATAYGVYASFFKDRVKDERAEAHDKLDRETELAGEWNTLTNRAATARSEIFSNATSYGEFLGRVRRVTRGVAEIRMGENMLKYPAVPGDEAANATNAVLRAKANYQVADDLARQYSGVYSALTNGVSPAVVRTFDDSFEGAGYATRPGSFQKALDKAMGLPERKEDN